MRFANQSNEPSIKNGGGSPAVDSGKRMNHPITFATHNLRANLPPSLLGFTTVKTAERNNVTTIATSVLTTDSDKGIDRIRNEPSNY